MRRRVVIVGLMMVALLAGFRAVRAISRPGAISGKPAAQSVASTPATVTVVTAGRADVTTTVTTVGTVTSLREARVASKITGRVAAVLVKEGDRVAAGQPLLRLDTSDLVVQETQAQADVAAARARLEQLLAGARPEERQQAADVAAQAKAALDAARARLQALETGARPQEREQAANAVAQAKTQMDWALLDVQRLRALYAQGAVAKTQMDFAETQLRMAQAAYDTARQQQMLVNEGPRVEDIQGARAQVAQAQAAYDAARQHLRLVNLGPRDEEIRMARAGLARAEASVSAARVLLQNATVVAPFAGTIAQRMVEPGEIASPAAPSFLLAQLGEVIVELSVPERRGAALRVEQPVALQVDTLPGTTFRGAVSEIRPAATVASRSLTVKVRLPNPKGLLRPGMFARGAIVVGVRSKVLQVPERAVVVTSGKPIVWVVQSDRAVRREVTLGERAGGQVEITAGIEEGEQVVIEGQEGLTDNQPVAPRAPQH